MAKFRPLNKLNKRIEVLGSGDKVEFTCWAAVKGVRAEEIKAVMGTIAKRHIVFLVRSDNPQVQAIENFMTVRYQGDIYEIDLIKFEDAQSGWYSEIWVSMK